MRIVLGEKDLLCLLAGRTVAKQAKTHTVEIGLQDIGWSVMKECLEKAQAGDIRIPCDPGCEAERGHPGPCYIGGAPAPRMKGDEVPSREPKRKPSVSVALDEIPGSTQSEGRTPAKAPRRVLPPVRRRNREK